MSDAVSHADWELCLRVLRALSWGEARGWETERWKTLLNAVGRGLRKEARRAGVPWLGARAILREPMCVSTLRVLAVSLENRQAAIECSRLRPVVRRLRREIRLDLRSEPGRNRAQAPTEAELARTLEVLQAAKDTLQDIPPEIRAELASVVYEMGRRARRLARRARVEPRKLDPGWLLACEKELFHLCDGLRPDGDYREFKGLLAKVDRAFEKDVQRGLSPASTKAEQLAQKNQGRSSVEERRTHNAEDAGSSPAGPDGERAGRPRPFLSARERAREEGAGTGRQAERPSLLMRFLIWLQFR